MKLMLFTASPVARTLLAIITGNRMYAFGPVTLVIVSFDRAVYDITGLKED